MKVAVASNWLKRQRSCGTIRQGGDFIEVDRGSECFLNNARRINDERSRFCKCLLGLDMKVGQREADGFVRDL